jgi:hypothetical protein
LENTALCKLIAPYRDSKITKINVRGLGMFIHQRLAYRAMKVSAMAKLNLPPCPMPQKKYMNVIARRYAQDPANCPNFFLDATLAAPFNKLSSALDGAATIV